MEMARFGNWAVNAFRIEWKGNSEIEYAVPIPKIVATGDHKNCIYYQWLIEIADDTRFTPEDIYSLNTAFVFAMDTFRSELDIPAYALLAETLKEQQEKLNERRQRWISPVEKIKSDNSTWLGKLYKL